MADVFTIKVTGLAECIKKFRDTIPKKHLLAAMRKGMRAGQKIITATAKATAPKRTGAMSAAIKTRAIKRSRKYVGVKTQLGEGFYKGKTFYGAFVEFGHKVGSRKLGDSRQQVPGQHFLENAAKSVGNEAATIIVERTKYELEQAASRG